MPPKLSKNARVLLYAPKVKLSALAVVAVLCMMCECAGCDPQRATKSAPSAAHAPANHASNDSLTAQSHNTPPRKAHNVACVAPAMASERTLHCDGTPHSPSMPFSRSFQAPSVDVRAHKAQQGQQFVHFCRRSGLRTNVNAHNVQSSSDHLLHQHRHACAQQEAFMGGLTPPAHATKHTLHHERSSALVQPKHSPHALADLEEEEEEKEERRDKGVA